MDGRSILVTGAAGSLGSAAVRTLASRGWRVFAADIAEPAFPLPSVVPISMDVTSPDSVAEARAKIEALSPGLDAVLHMAGVYTMDSFIEIEEETLSRMIEVNLMGVYRVDREFLPLIRKAGGRIVITASELAPLSPLPFNGVYSMTKRALDAYAHSLALELDLIGTRVVTLYPGAYGDGMTRAAVKAMDRMSEKTRLHPGVTERFRDIVVSETGTAKPPEKLAERIADILEKKRPRFKYYLNNSLKLRLFSALPEGLQARLLRLLLIRKPGSDGKKSC